MVEQVLRDVERWVGDDLQRVRRQPRRLAGLLQELAGAGGAPCGGADGRMIKALRVFAQTIDLNSAVDVGLVIGRSARMTPIGSATYSRACSGSSSITPTDFLSFR